VRKTSLGKTTTMQTCQWWWGHSQVRTIKKRFGFDGNYSLMGSLEEKIHEGIYKQISSANMLIVKIKMKRLRGA
jgi:hypothetical protein